MASFSFEQAEKFGGNSSSKKNNVNFFKLANNGDSAVVRFMADSVSDFDILTVHNVTVDGKHRNINCIREATDSIDMCPLCASGVDLKPRFFAHIIEYVKDPTTGEVTPQARVWERPISFAKELKSYMENFGPLSDILFKIVRNGEARFLDTKYSLVPNINYGPMGANYPDEIYGKHPELFENYKALGHVVMNKSGEDLVTFVTTGSFPQENEQNSEPSYPQNYQQPVGQTVGTVGDITSKRDDMPWNKPQQNVARPIRNF